MSRRPDMTKRERVLAALAGEPVDRPPFSFWSHNYARENSAEELAAESLRVAEAFQFDFLKPQTRAQAFEEAFGAVWQASGRRRDGPTLLKPAVSSAADLGQLRPADWTAGPLGEQLAALRMIRAAIGDLPIIWTIFNPLMIARRLQPGDISGLRTAMHEHPRALRSALDAVTETMVGYARAALDAGADGLFYATNVGTASQLTTDEYRTWSRDDDLKILHAVSGGTFNLLHTCGDAVLFDVFVEYPVHAFNYALGGQNPGLAALAERTGKAVAGGVTTKPADLALTPTMVAAEVRAAVRDTAGRHLLIAPGCSNSPVVADSIAAAGRDAVLALG
jgi:uroporphyrinogen decarboxylase